MTPQEKAQELVNKYYQLAESIEWTDKETSVKAEKFNDELGTDVLRYWNELAKQSALVAVEEVMVYLDQIMLPNPFKQYWEEVKHEIEKL
jgi:hypothetical protein